MNLALKHINTLPTRTWNRLGINDTSFLGTIPEPAAYRGEILAAPLPEGVLKDAGFSGPAPQSASGEETTEFALTNRTCGVTLRVPAGVKVKTPVLLSFRVDETNPSVVDVNTVVAEEGSEITVAMAYRSEPEFKGFHFGLTRLIAEKNAVIHLIQVQMLGDGCVGFDDVGASAAQDAEIDVVQAELGGLQAYAGCKALLAGYQSRLNLDAIYFGDSTRKVDINYIAQHTGKKTQSEIHVNGALLDESRKSFRGTIDFVRGAKRAVGHESEFNLLFSPKVRNKTAPLILCAEEDVEGQHAASTGRIDAQRLFYLMSRGLDETAAKKLVIEAQFRPVMEKIPDVDARTDALNYVETRLNRIESLCE